MNRVEWVDAMNSGWNWVAPAVLPDGLRVYYQKVSALGQVCVLEPIPGCWLVFFADYFEGVLHSNMDLWRAGLLEASSEDPGSWPTLELFWPREEWPASMFVWMTEDDPRLPVRVRLDRQLNRIVATKVAAT